MPQSATIEPSPAKRDHRWLIAARGHLPPSRFLNCDGPLDLRDVVEVVSGHHSSYVLDGFLGKSR
jgi:hypothetical protein